MKDGPQLGYLWNAPDRTLRPILGIPGSSQIGKSLVPAGLYAGGAASSTAAIALLIETDGSLDLLPLPQATESRLPATVSVSAAIRFSAAGKSAVAFTPGGNALLLITGLPGAPQQAVVPLQPNVALNDVAVADDGQLAIAAASSGSIAISALTHDGRSTPLTSVGQLGGLNFLAGSEDLLVADAAQNSLQVVRSVAGARTTQSLTTPLLNQPLAVAGSMDKRWVLVANGGDSNLVRLDLSAQTPPAKLPCACTPSLIAPLDGNGVFRIVDIGTGPTWFVDAASATPQMYFIPAIQITATAATGTKRVAR